MTTQVYFRAALLCYLLFIGGLVIFIISPALEKNSWTHILLMGILFGLITYTNYDLTSLATKKNWPLVTDVDYM